MKHIKDGLAIVVQVMAGLLGGIMVLGLIPGDGIDVDTTGALVIAALSALAYLGARTYRKNLHV